MNQIWFWVAFRPLCWYAFSWEYFGIEKASVDDLDNKLTYSRSNSLNVISPKRLRNMEISVSFGENGRIRVLDAEKYEQTKQLQEQCSNFSSSTSIFFWIVNSFLFFCLKFLTSILTLLFYLFRLELDEFNSTIATLVEVMDGQATKIERAKLKAIGQRNKVDSEEGRRKTKATELKAQINEDLTDLERLRAEHDSLNAVELEQRSLIERLSNNA